jgi:hypothetical protein
MVCLRNISVDTLHKGDTEDNNNNNNNNDNYNKRDQELAEELKTSAKSCKFSGLLQETRSLLEQPRKAQDISPRLEATALTLFEPNTS